MVDHARPGGGHHLHHLADGDELAIAVAHLQGEHIVHVAAPLTLQLHDHAPHLIAFEAVVHIGAAKAGLQGGHQLIEIHP